MILLFLWAIMAVIVAMIASAKGRGAFGWFLYAFLIWPIALVHVLLVEKKGAAAAAARAPADPDEGRRPCPHCAEMILPEAKVCRFCHGAVEPLPAEPAPYEFAPET